MLIVFDPPDGLEPSHLHVLGKPSLHHWATSPTLGVLLLFVCFCLTVFHYASQADLELVNVVQGFSNSQYSFSFLLDIGAIGMLSDSDFSKAVETGKTERRALQVRW